MKTVKVLNNNLVLAEDDQGEEVIVGGKAIGYDGKTGEEIKEERIEKIYVLDNKNDTSEYIKLIEKTPQIYVDITQSILKNANEILQGRLHDQIFITLIDHINFAIQRYKEGVIIQNRLLWEAKKFYPKEFSIGKDAVAYINKTLGIELPEEEAGNITFHLVNAQSDEQNMANTIQEVRMVKDILDIVRYQYTGRINEDSLDYTRFITHLRFFAHRLIENKLMKSDDDFLFLQITNKYKEEYECAKKIEAYINKSMNIELSKDEMIYLTIYIKRIVE